MNELMIHVEKAVRGLQISQPQRREIREELLQELQAIYDRQRECCESQNAALEASIGQFGDPEAIAKRLKARLPWYSPLMAAIPWFAPVRSWPESAWRVTWRASMTGIMFWIVVGIPWCCVLVATQRRTLPEAGMLWLLMALLGIAMLGPFVGMTGSIHGVFGMLRSSARAVLFAIIGCTAQLAIYLSMGQVTGAGLQPPIYGIPVALSIGALLFLRLDFTARLIEKDEQRDRRTGQWEQLVIDD